MAEENFPSQVGQKNFKWMNDEDTKILLSLNFANSLLLDFSFCSSSSANCINYQMDLEQSFNGRKVKFDALSWKVENVKVKVKMWKWNLMLYPGKSKMLPKFVILKLPHKMLKWFKTPEARKHITYSVFQFNRKRLFSYNLKIWTDTSHLSQHLQITTRQI